MKKSIIASLALALVLSFSSFGGTQKAEAADWSTTGSIWTTFYHSGSFTNYVYQRNMGTSYSDEIWTAVDAKSSASGTFKAILQKKTNGVWKNYRTKYPKKNGYTDMDWTGVTKGATYRIKFENTSSSKITYTFNVMQ
ncbi:hypothetical protein NGI46_15870 [Peribacillus butanolivorans]|uniref:hypothetical protein n=1 Tax=Peribacillus butanolivorans TaxID=421767 RepID=UPI00207CBE48|nr:hypothetical protein [Peribacillus butanolivorans]MCO0598902.1 hypothetical protein [Peribacillus butanolivorans]